MSARAETTSSSSSRMNMSKEFLQALLEHSEYEDIVGKANKHFVFEKYYGVTPPVSTHEYRGLLDKSTVARELYKRILKLMYKGALKMWRNTESALKYAVYAAPFVGLGYLSIDEAVSIYRRHTDSAIDELAGLVALRGGPQATYINDRVVLAGAGDHVAVIAFTQQSRPLIIDYVDAGKTSRRLRDMLLQHSRDGVGRATGAGAAELARLIGSGVVASSVARYWARVLNEFKQKSRCQVMDVLVEVKSDGLVLSRRDGQDNIHTANYAFDEIRESPVKTMYEVLRFAELHKAVIAPMLPSYSLVLIYNHVAKRYAGAKLRHLFVGEDASDIEYRYDREKDIVVIREKIPYNDTHLYLLYVGRLSSPYSVFSAVFIDDADNFLVTPPGLFAAACLSPATRELLNSFMLPVEKLGYENKLFLVEYIVPETTFISYVDEGIMAEWIVGIFRPLVITADDPGLSDYSIPRNYRVYAVNISTLDVVRVRRGGPVLPEGWRAADTLLVLRWEGGDERPYGPLGMIIREDMLDGSRLVELESRDDENVHLYIELRDNVKALLPY